MDGSRPDYQTTVSLLDNVRPRLDPGERLQFAFTGQTGINPAFLWIPSIDFLVIANRARIIVFTDRRIAVFSAGQLSWRRTKAKRLLYSLARSTVLPHGKRSWSRLVLGNERIWVSRKAYAYLDEATDIGA